MIHLEMLHCRAIVGVEGVTLRGGQSDKVLKLKLAALTEEVARGLSIEIEI